MKILFLGAPGSGKSTQGKLLAKDKGFDWISSGQLFRDANDPEALKYIRQALLVPDDITEKMVMEAIRDKENVILDGFPRNLAQCQFLEREKVDFDVVIEIVVPKDELLKRMKQRGRGDDTDEGIVKRIGDYEAMRDVVAGFYQNKGVRVIRIDGVGEIAEVQARIREVIA